MNLESDPDRAMALCRAAQARLMGRVRSLAAERARQPSRLPGWSVGHVLTHLARNADAHTRRLEASPDDRRALMAWLAGRGPLDPPPVLEPW